MSLPSDPSFPAVSRRRFVQMAGLLVALPLTGCGSDSDDDRVADTTSGSFRGSSQAGVLSFKGIPYAQAPVGALRFKSPKAVRPVAGITDATQFGPSSLQTLPPYVQWIYTQPQAMSEDCLTLNVWTPDKGGKLPVLVFLHGGAWRTGSSALPLVDGQALASMGCVVVTVTFRLGGLATLSHPAFTDPDTGMQANWQLQDQMSALQWVGANIAQFGGDPANICLAGQSAGGTSAAILAQHPTTRSLVRQAVLLSPARSASPSAFTLTDAAAYTELLAARLGTTVAGLASLPAATVQQGESELNQLPLPTTFTSGRGAKAGPIIDGKSYLTDWTRNDWPASTPVLIMNTLTEGTFFVDLFNVLTNTRATAELPTTRAAVLTAITGLAGSPANAERVMAAYETAAAAEGRSTLPGDLYVEIYGDGLLRYDGYRYANQLAAAGRNVRYGTYAHAIKAPARGVPHCAELPMIFGTYGQDFYRTKVGAGAAGATLSQRMMASLVSFARDGNPVFASGSTWPAYQPAQARSVQIGVGDTADVVTAEVPKVAQLQVWTGILG